MNAKNCTFSECDEPYYAKGLCRGHRKQERKGKELTPLRKLDLPSVGDTFNRWTVKGESFTERDDSTHFRRYVPCVCECGIKRTVLFTQLKEGHSKSCGCWKVEHVDAALAANGIAHGMSYKHPLYTRWMRIRRRCYSPQAHNYKYYGGRGIGMCAEWRDDFPAFAAWIDANLGPRPSSKTLDRIDNDGNYEPGNVRWATQAEQNANKQCSNGCSLHHQDGCPGT